jgi:hypothetical protein
MTPSAAKLYKDFQDLPVDKTVNGNIPQPSKLNALGPVRHIVYISQKWAPREGRSGKQAWLRYIHDFKVNPPLLCNDPAHRHYHIIGKVSVRPEGICDYKGSGPGNKGSKTNYEIPAHLTFLGYLDEVVYTSIEDDEDYKVEFGKNKALCSNPSGLKLFIASLT